MARDEYRTLLRTAKEAAGISDNKRAGIDRKIGASQAANASGFTSRLAIRVSKHIELRSSSRLGATSSARRANPIDRQAPRRCRSGNFVMLKLLAEAIRPHRGVVSAEYAKHFPRFMDEGLHGLVGVCHLPVRPPWTSVSPPVMEQQVFQCRD